MELRWIYESLWWSHPPRLMKIICSLAWYQNWTKSFALIILLGHSTNEPPLKDLSRFKVVTGTHDCPQGRNTRPHYLRVVSPGVAPWGPLHLGSLHRGLLYRGITTPGVAPSGSLPEGRFTRSRSLRVASPGIASLGVAPWGSLPESRFTWGRSIWSRYISIASLGVVPPGSLYPVFASCSQKSTRKRTWSQVIY